MEQISNQSAESKSLDITDANIEQLKQIFPDVFSEGKVDFDALKAALGEAVDDSDERYNFTWNGKNRARQIAQTPSTGTLRPYKEDSVNWNSTENLFIEGDNLEVLKLLQKSYHKKVKMIYIDPPYNTGKDFVYKDDFQDNISNYLKTTSQTDSDGNVFSSNPETSGRYHSAWLNMMYPRLKLARNLLKDDGVIYISIDESEIINMRKVCDEIYGEDCFLGSIIWKKKTNGNNMGYIPPVHDYIIAYGKKDLESAITGFPLTKEFIEKTYSNPDNDERGAWTTSDLSANHKGPYFEIVNDATGQAFLPPKGRYWVFNEEEVKRRIKDGRIIFGKSGNSAPIQKKYLKERTSNHTKPDSWWDKHGYNSDGTKEIANLLGPKVFDHSKPTVLLKKLLLMTVDEHDTVLDFFAGSGSTAHAAYDFQTEHELPIKTISVQLPEKTDAKSVACSMGYKTISELSLARIKKVIAESTQEHGIKVFKLDETNIRRWDADFDDLAPALQLAAKSIKESRTAEDVLYEILLKYGIELTTLVEEENIKGKQVFVVGAGALIVCLDDDITEAVVEGIAALIDELEPESTQVVFKDEGFANDDNVKTNAVQILKQHGVEDVKSI
ncbi:site-specific DNA-methyltransferase [Pseudoalteromonas arctica]|uniref:site-specific DNA-methyltransferase (adenine-specific) n=2 Tax=Pseudoalteromonas arctica TaxID=394751 RepID=A0A7Y0DS10_9GAMM|nr:site-specific DNA-methyltransferase [Pseudoalteromonas arctica]